MEETKEYKLSIEEELLIGAELSRLNINNWNIKED